MGNGQGCPRLPLGILVWHQGDKGIAADALPLGSALPHPGHQEKAESSFCQPSTTAGPGPSAPTIGEKQKAPSPWEDRAQGGSPSCCALLEVLAELWGLDLLVGVIWGSVILGCCSSASSPRHVAAHSAFAPRP